MLIVFATCATKIIPGHLPTVEIQTNCLQENSKLFLGFLGADRQLNEKCKPRVLKSHYSWNFLAATDRQMTRRKCHTSKIIIIRDPTAGHNDGW